MLKKKTSITSRFFLELLRLNDEIIKELLYIKELGDQKLFFRRIRIPPLLNVFWNNIFINHSVRKVLLSLVNDPKECVESGFDALKKCEQMKQLAKKLNIPVDDIEYMTDTFYILALARQYYFEPYSLELRQKIKAAKKQYKIKYPKNIRPRYRIKTNYTPFTISRKHMRWIIKVSLRKKRGYRVLDYLLTLHLLGILYRIFVRTRPKTVPKFARKHAMGIDTIFK